MAAPRVTGPGGRLDGRDRIGRDYVIPAVLQAVGCDRRESRPKSQNCIECPIKWRLCAIVKCADTRTQVTSVRVGGRGSRRVTSAHAVADARSTPSHAERNAHAERTDSKGQAQHGIREIIESRPDMHRCMHRKMRDRRDPLLAWPCDVSGGCLQRLHGYLRLTAASQAAKVTLVRR